ncbi:MAG: hypothetical protein A2V63_01540 [Candidatus Eisenbacteria bacterium RBG_19FT_COMBO_70_11]|nr:MAG: hypothetical protein A2V63_01540 [Candidatus Eisenbacteria bacterium RBG_19FT_COMBO_70_11]
MAKRRKKRTQYTEADRKKILAAAQAEGLTAAQVKKRFGVQPVTYYSWRKKRGVTGRRGRRPAAGAGSLASQVQEEVRSRVQQILPAIVRSEVGSYLTSLFRRGGGRRQARRKK